MPLLCPAITFSLPDSDRQRPVLWDAGTLLFFAPSLVPRLLPLFLILCSLSWGRREAGLEVIQTEAGDTLIHSQSQVGSCGEWCDGEGEGEEENMKGSLRIFLWNDEEKGRANQFDQNKISSKKDRRQNLLKDLLWLSGTDIRRDLWQLAKVLKSKPITREESWRKMKTQLPVTDWFCVRG